MRIWKTLLTAAALLAVAVADYRAARFFFYAESYRRDTGSVDASNDCRVALVCLGGVLLLTAAMLLLLCIRASDKMRSVGPRPRESVEGKEAEVGDVGEAFADGGRRCHSTLTAGRSQDGVLLEARRPLPLLRTVCLAQIILSAATLAWLNPFEPVVLFLRVSPWVSPALGLAALIMVLTTACIRQKNRPFPLQQCP